MSGNIQANQTWICDMAEPTQYDKDYDFSAFQSTKPDEPLPGDRLDTELQNIETALDETQGALRDIRRSDGQLRNGIVTPESISPLTLTVLGIAATPNEDVITVAENIEDVVSVADNMAAVLAAEGNAISAAEAAEAADDSADAAKEYAENANAQSRYIVFENYATGQEAVDAAIAAGKSEIDVEQDYSAPHSMSNRSNVLFRGDGSFSGVNTNSGNYRRQVVPLTSPDARAFPDRFSISERYSGTVSAVLIGDSLGTYGANTISASDALATRLSEKLAADNPTLEIAFKSRAIGGQTFGTADDVPVTSFPIADRYPWYTDDMRPWLDYVEDLSPDIVFISFGMNDKQNFDRTKLESVVSKIEAMPTSPQIVFVTNMAPNLSPHPDNASFGSYIEQEGRDSVAGWVRTYANYHGYPLIDVNRTFNMVRDGRDILDTYLVEQDEVTFGSASAYIADADQACRDFSLKAEIEAAAWTNLQPLSINLCGTSVNSDGANNVVFVDDDAGFLRFKFFRGGPSSLYLQVTSEIPTPIVDTEVEISLRNGEFSFRLYPASAGADAGVQPFTQKVITYGGLFIPTIFYFGGGGAGPVLSATLSVGVERPYKPAVTDLDLWGEPTSGTGGNRPITGGNGVNHPTSQGAAIVYGTHFSANSYRLPQVVDVVGDGGQVSINGRVLSEHSGIESILHTWRVNLGANTRSCSLIGPETDSALDPFIWATGNSWLFRIDNVDALVIDETANVLVPTSNFLVGKTEIGGTTVGAELRQTGLISVTSSGNTVARFNRLLNDGQIVAFQQDSVIEGDITVSGTTVSYNNFMGAHYSELDAAKGKKILRGTIVEATGNLVDQRHTRQARLSKFRVCETPGSKAVYGVIDGPAIQDKDELYPDQTEWEGKRVRRRQYMIAAVGAGFIRIKKGETVKVGDLIENAGGGVGRAQEDDTIRSSTVAKITSAHVVETYPDGSTLVPCVLYCG